jgi:sugar phosphate isomerase/epimerase
MRIAISNLAWDVNDDESVLEAMLEAGIHGVEIAPTKVWSSPDTVKESDAKRYREFWGARGIQVIAMQALLFGRADLTIFGKPDVRRKTLDYLAKMVYLGELLGAHILVFGSPKNRKVGALSGEMIDSIAIPFFQEIGTIASDHHLIFCLEPNPPIYGCDYITTLSDGVRLVQKVQREGFGLHLDAAGMTLSGEALGANAENAIRIAKHFHISDVDLAPVGSGTVDHLKLASILRKMKYEQWTSIEMRASTGSDNVNQIRKALRFAKDTYGNGE